MHLYVTAKGTTPRHHRLALEDDEDDTYEEHPSSHSAETFRGCLATDHLRKAVQITVDVLYLSSFWTYAA